MDEPSRTHEILTMLASGPSQIAGLTAGLSAEQLKTSPAAGAWSLRDILAHLRACSDMWGQAIQIILDQDRPSFKAVNPGTWIKQTDYLTQEFQPSLAAFTSQRAGLLAVLERLAPDAWLRSATVTGFGKARERTVYAYAEWLATHERSHMKPIKRLAAALR